MVTALGQGVQGYRDILPGYSPPEEFLKQRKTEEKTLISYGMSSITRAQGDIRTSLDPKY